MIETAKKAVLCAAPILLENFRKISGADVREKRVNDFLTFVDEQAEKEIIRVIHEHHPDHSIMAEESGEDIKSTEFRWIIDPLDGTKNYINGIPVFGISIAVQKSAQTIAGAIYYPLQQELYTAVLGEGAFCGGKRISVSSETRLKNCLLATGFPFKQKQHLDVYLECFKDIFKRISGKRRMGAASIDLAYVAAGRFDAFWEFGLSAWDMAAGALLITEAGGVCTDFLGEANFLTNSCMLCGNKYVHPKLLDITRYHFGKITIE